MGDYLLFRLYGPMAAWGDVAVGEVRPSQTHPGRSAVLGLVAAALGLDRDQHAALAELEPAYGVAVRIERAGDLLRDYHTVQTPPARRGAVWRTRRDELAEANLYTILSTRDYRCDARYTVAIWVRNAKPPLSLEALAAALSAPRFPLYLGRKSCPPALPLAPRVVAAETLRDAFAAMELLPALQGDGYPWPRGDDPMRVCWDEHDAHGYEQVSAVIRRDAVRDRGRWQFDERQEHQGFHPPGEG